MKTTLDDILDRALADKRIVGGVLLVEERGAPVYARALGLSDREAGRAMMINSVIAYVVTIVTVISAVPYVTRAMSAVRGGGA